MTELDWRDWGIVPLIVNQGICGSCYAFSTAACVESAKAIQTGVLYKTSEQYIISCDTDNMGCVGGS